MRRIALINQKGGVGKTTSAVNLGAALARAGKRVALIDLDPQANLSLHLDRAVRDGETSIYSVLTGAATLAQALQSTSTNGLTLVPSSIDLSGAELELANVFGRELLLREALERWESDARASSGAAPVDYVLIDCPPSLGLLAVNGLVAAREVLIAVQTEFFALQGMSKLMDVLQVLRRRLNPALETCGILPCLYDNRLKLAREVLAEVRRYFPGQVFARPIGKNVKLAEAPGYGKTIFEYAPESPGAHDYEAVAREVIAREPGQARASAQAVAPVAHEVTEAVQQRPSRTSVGPPARKRPGASKPAAAQQPSSTPQSDPALLKPQRAALEPEPPQSEPVKDRAVPQRAGAAVHESTPALQQPAVAAQPEKPSTNGRKPRVLRATAPEKSAQASAQATVLPHTPQSASKASEGTAAPSTTRRRGAPRVVGDLSLD